MFSLQTFAWSTKMSWSVSTRIPYVVEVCEETFVKMNDLLERVGEGLAEDRIPSQEQECMVVAGLNLLRLQVDPVHICFSFRSAFVSLFKCSGSGS